MDDQRSTQGSTTAESGTWGDPELRERIARAMHADTEGIEPLGAADLEEAAGQEAPESGSPEAPDPELRESIARAMHADTEGIEPLGAAEAERAAARDARRARPTRS
jgi:hypothetical protein